MDDKATTLQSFDIQRILRLLPHRYPFLLIDRIVDVDGDNAAVGIKSVTVNEPFFAGHFPGMPIMPGVLLIEGMAQTAGAICAAQPRSDDADGGLFHDHRPGQVPQAGHARRHRGLSRPEAAPPRQHLEIPRRGPRRRRQGRRGRHQRDDRRARCGRHEANPSDGDRGGWRPSSATRSRSGPIRWSAPTSSSRTAWCWNPTSSSAGRPRSAPARGCRRSSPSAARRRTSPTRARRAASSSAPIASSASTRRSIAARPRAAARRRWAPIAF